MFVELCIVIESLLLAFSGLTESLAYNQLQFCSNATWNVNGSTIADRAALGDNPDVLFVSSSDMIYGANRDANHILVWKSDDTWPDKIISSDFTRLWSVFVNDVGDVFIGDGKEQGRVIQRLATGNMFTVVISVEKPCRSLFIDKNNTFYCSMIFAHKVVKQSLNEPGSPLILAAGTDTWGASSKALAGPWGIFVDVNFDLYVADSENHRIQLFVQGQTTAKTVAGKGSKDTKITLSLPSGVFLDRDKHVFIVDSGNHRIIGSGSDGFRCLVGCGSAGALSHQLISPTTLSFDSHGNMLVADAGNNRIQKFYLAKDSCGT